ncbi:putative guanine nucleotide-binding proteinhypothetical protein [Cryptosporidium ryanae]|uniref:putative guanine nucleotide-binding proteinhypothetical protein n=1 Tax=Cryptosporidium ryanae TaxID=515981 RepID=UPI00351A65EB|nr:putative guanine nucleotide-binding proteinhypothetical protein [Cryptosporidium ryanae]
MSLICSISGVVPEEPVISKTGYIFEKRLIHDYIRCNNCCPVTKDKLSLDDLIDIKAENNVRPRVISNTSIPGILDSLRTEWDAVMMEMFQLKSELEQTKMQLSHTLYQHDASCRVIARISRERDNAIKRLAEIQENINTENNSFGVSLSAEKEGNGSETQNCNSGDKHVDSTSGEKVKRQRGADASTNMSSTSSDTPNNKNDAISKEIISEFEEYSERVRPIRKAMKFPNIVSSEQVKRYKCTNEIQIDTRHKLTHSCFVSDYILVSGHENGQVIVSNIYDNLDSNSSDSSGKYSHVIAKIPPMFGESSKFNGVKFISSLTSNDAYFSEYKEIPDKILVNYLQDPTSIHVYRKDEDGKSFHHALNLNVINNSGSNSKFTIESFQVHPIKRYILANYKTAQNNAFTGNFTLLDTEVGTQICNYSLNADNGGLSDYYSDIKVHPDGIILGGIYSSGNVIDIWDLRTSGKITSIGPSPSNILPLGNTRRPNKSFISFSNNGYHLFSTHDLKIHLWDLRKSSLLDSIDSGFIHKNNQTHCSENNLRINLDESGKYISSIYENGISVLSFAGKNKLERINSFSIAHTNHCQNSHFSTDVKFVSTVSNDNIVNIWSCCNN